MGCGWLGLPLGKSLIKKGFKVKGTTTSPEKLPQLSATGIDSFLIQLNENDIKGDFESFCKGVEVLIVNIPPRLRKPPFEDYVKKTEQLIKGISKTGIGKVVFISSTSVYGNVDGEITEDTLPKPFTESAKQLFKAEKLMMQVKGIDTTVVRFGGLIGVNRHPIHHLTGRKDLHNGDETINLIHLGDCINLIENIVEQNFWNKLINGVYPYHPTKRDYYTDEAKKRNLSIPEYAKKNQKESKKIIKSNFFLTKYQYPITSP